MNIYAFATWHCEEGIVFIGYPVVPLIHSFVCLSVFHSFGQILLPWYLVNGLNNFDKNWPGIVANLYWIGDKILEVKG